ncbi:MAG: hypothetical protein KatS3mg001_364 [Candidatus Pacearchaeota archaeon]|nr:MAG: hypothetical protein KatS3mg001_364 [Candidatus Pacearchaeota archaeon]
MAEEITVLQHWIFTKFVFPFFLLFFIVFGLLEKTNLFGSGKKQLNALVAFIVGLIFVSSVFPKYVVNNLILFLTIALMTAFVGLILWGFVSGGEAKITNKGLQKFVAFLIFVSLAAILFWSFGLEFNLLRDIFNFIFLSNWSKDFWINFLFIALIIIALGLIIGKPTGGKKP